MRAWDSGDVMIDDNDRLTLTRSLEAEVLAAFAVPPRADGLTQEALLSALQSIKPAARQLSDALGNAGFKQVSSEDQPALDWVDAVFNYWAEHYPLAPELQEVVHGARPLAAAFAVKDNRFFVPGGHALHRLLDVIHTGMVGWYAGLGPSASNAIEGAREALERSCKDFPSEPRVDETLDLLSQKIDAHAAQLKRLDSALLERESATMGGEIARLSTAIAINDILREHQVPGSVARFIKSDWYESGKLVVQRYGIGSGEWNTFLETTHLLVDAVQPVATDDAMGQQRLQGTMQQLPSTLSRQLLSLQPDNDAIAGAVGLIEYALLRNMRGEDLGLLQAEPIVEHGIPEDGIPSEEDLAAQGIVQGSWYALDTADGEVRIRLTGGLASNIYLLFMDFLGARAVRKSYTEFKSLLRSGEARPLHETDSFCRAMVEATEVQEQIRRGQQAEQARLAEIAAEEERRKQAEMATTLSGQADPAIYRQEASQYGASNLEQHDSYQSHQSQDPSGYQQQGQPPEPHNHFASPAKTHFDDPNSRPSVDTPYESNTVVKLQLPMGTWLGFHDRDPPLMARVAVRDMEKDSYIFTNREGIKLRELTVSQLIALIDRDMVDILERKTNFRETVNQMRRDQDRLSGGVSPASLY